MSSDSSNNRPENQREALKHLREQAERRILQVRSTEGKPLPEMQQLVQELQVYQIELEMQYEQLLATQEVAETLRAQFADLYEFAPVGYFTLDTSGQILQLNLHACQLLGSVRQQLVRRRFPLFVVLEQRQQFHDFLQGLPATEYSQTCELAMQRQDGTRFQGQLNGLAVRDEQNQLQLRLALSDVSARHEATAALAASESRFRLLFEKSKEAILLLQEMKILDCNAATLALLHATTKEQVVGSSVLTLAPEYQPDGRLSADVMYEHMRHLQRHGAHRFERWQQRFTGEFIWVEITLTQMQLNGQPLVYAVWRDITAQREDREQLRQEKEFTESLLNNSVDGIFAFSKAGYFTAWNRTMEQHTGKKAAEVVGQEMFSVFPTHRGGPEETAVRRTLAGDRFVEYDLSFHTTPGSYESYMVPLLDADGTVSGGLVIIRDVTERMRLLEEARQAELRQQKEVLKAVLIAQEEERRRISESLHNGVGQLLYAAKLNLEAPVGGNKTRAAALSLLDEAIKATRTISFELTPSILEDFGLEAALEELVKRVPQHSIDVQAHLVGLGVPLPRLLQIAVYRVVQELLNNILKHAQAQEVYLHVVHEDDTLHISVEDNGVGFEPTLLTTPPTGIGLASIRSRIDLLGGQLTIDSRPGRGTIIGIELPVLRE